MKVRAGVRVRGQGSHAHRQPKVDEHGVARGGDQDVLELQVEVQHPARVQLAERERDLEIPAITQGEIGQGIGKQPSRDG